MKFSEMTYTRPIYEKVRDRLEDLHQRFANSSSAKECFSIYKEYDDYCCEFNSMFILAYIRNTLDTNDKFYAAEKDYQNEVYPKLKEVLQKFSVALLESPFRKDMEYKWGSLMFINAEMELKTFKPEIVADLQEENALKTEHNKLIASAQIDFDGKTLTLAQLQPYYENSNRSIRKAAVEAAAKWYMGYAEQFDSLFDKLVKIRTKIAKKLGYENFVQLGYYRMQRNCYDQDMVANFRKGILEHIVPIVTALKNKQAKRIGVDTIKTYDQSFEYPDGNAKPIGTADDIFAHGKKMYHELSEETAGLIDFMLENELFDVMTRPGKSAGGYCHYIPQYKTPFIFANFNGTSGDIDVLTHEIGHALAGYTARDIYPSALRYYTSETAEIHSMSMEFFTWPWMDGFFGEQTDKYYNSHLSGALSFLPFGAIGDEFQHIIYQNPDMTPAERNQLWLKLESKYRPWFDLTDTPFHGEGRRWQGIMHIFERPFYYIDYCLAQIMALSFWAENQSNPKQAWEKYMRLIGFAGAKTFVDLIANAGLPTPFEAVNIKAVADVATEWLEKTSNF